MSESKKEFIPWTQPWIVCAANRNKTTGVIVCGARHFDRVMKTQVEAIAPWYAKYHRGLMLRYWWSGWSQADQGFIDQWGRFYKREEAAQLAAQNGQCAKGINILYSEDLY